MKKTTIIILLIIMIVLSLFTGISINRNFSFLYEIAFVDMPKIVVQGYQGKALYTILFIVYWILLLTAHIGIILLPFLYFKFKSRKFLIYIPLAFLVLQFFVLYIFEFILIPFAVIWLIALQVSKEFNKERFKTE